MALRVDPDFALAHHFLGIALLAKGRRDEVFEDYPKGIESLNRLRGSALQEANEYYNQACLNDPKWVAARNGLRVPPRDAARLDEAVDHFRQAIRLEPGRPDSYGALGLALLAKRQFAEADAAIGRCLELLPAGQKDRRGNLDRLRDRCRHLLALDGRLADVVRGTDKPAADECLDAAELCYVKQHYATAHRLFGEALAAAPKLTEDMPAGHRFNAACAAVLVGCCRGDDVAGLGEPDRAGWRRQAREWLRQDLDAWAKRLQPGEPPDRVAARRALAGWRDDPDLAGVRAADALARLPAEERRDWERLWSDVDLLLRRASRPE